MSTTCTTTRPAAPPMRRARARSTARTGFTLVEILAVVVILGIASAMIIPQMGARGDLKAAAAARVIMADLIYAQNRAISTQKWQYVKFDVGSNCYSLLDNAGSSVDHVITHPVNKSPYFMQFGPGGSIAPDVTIQSAVFNGVDSTYRPEFTVCFDELGTPYVFCYDAGTTNEMLDGAVVVKSGDASLTIRIERYTGEISVQ